MKKERTKAKKYANKGITLIALVITIIVCTKFLVPRNGSNE